MYSLPDHEPRPHDGRPRFVTIILRSRRIYGEQAWQLEESPSPVGEVTHGGRRGSLGQRGRGAGRRLKRKRVGSGRGGARNEADRSWGVESDVQIVFWSGSRSSNQKINITRGSGGSLL